MSTTFGIPADFRNIELVNDELPEECKNDEVDVNDDYNDEFIKVAKRFSDGSICWLNPLAPLLPSQTKIYPILNTAQGIYTIGDIKTIMQKQDK